MTIENNTNGLGVNQNYGTRSTDEGRLSEKSRTDSQLEIEVAFHGDDYTVVTGVIPAGAKLREALLVVNEAFVIGGTTPTVNIGTSGSAATNGVDISEAQAEATGVYDLAGQGTWAAILAADTTVAVELGGTSPTITSAGHAVVKLFFDVITF